MGRRPKAMVRDQGTSERADAAQGSGRRGGPTRRATQWRPSLRIVWPPGGNVTGATHCRVLRSHGCDGRYRNRAYVSAISWASSYSLANAV